MKSQSRHHSLEKNFSQVMSGFTIIELMVVVAILAIVSAIAAPSFRSMIGTMNTKSVAFDLVSDLAAARSEAITRNRDISLVPVVAGEWTKGWQVTDGGSVLFSHPAIDFSMNISAPTNGVIFSANGRLSDEQAANKTWLISSTVAGVTSRCIVITPTGAARSKYGGC